MLRAEKFNLKCVEVLRDSSSTFLCRAFDAERDQDVILKLISNHPDNRAAQLALQNEYSIAEYLCGQVTSVPKPLRFVKSDTEQGIVYRDNGGTSLKRMLDERELDFTDELEIAIAVARIINDVHRCGVIHRDLCSSNILVAHDSTDQRWDVQIIDFGLAQVEPLEETLHESKRVEGTIGYLSPEQVGRGAVVPDRRSDLYSLGATLYELFSGALPFEETDPAQLLHRHVARDPNPLEERASDIPKPISEIVSKLLKKSPDERYQSAAGLVHDLERLRDAEDITSSFPLGERDASERFAFPQKLYGRDRKIGELLKLFGEAADGACRVVMVQGYAGIGKTSLVREFLPSVHAHGGYVLSGKFDQDKGDIPYECLVHAFQPLIRRILSEQSEQLEQWRERLIEALSVNGRLITTVIPELELVIGAQPSVRELEPEESKNRFKQVFRSFLSTFMTSDHPLVMFLDDLQWTDKASLELIHGLVTDSKSVCLLLIGAYRSNEVGPEHPLMETLRRVSSSGIRIHDVELEGLTRDQVSQMARDLLRLSPEQLVALVDLCYEKTEGNPFFLEQFLSELHSEGAIRFNRETMKWSYDILEVERHSVSDNVVDLMLQKIGRLPEATQRSLEMAACIGTQFDVELLASCLELSALDTVNSLWIANKERLIEPVSNVSTLRPAARTSVSAVYQFVHDRVRQAANARLSGEERTEHHLRIGRRLRETSSSGRVEIVFEVVEQYSMGLELVTDRDERLELVKLYLTAGKLAVGTVAYQSARSYLVTGLELLGELVCKDKRSLLAEYFVELAEIAHVQGDFSRAETLIERGLEHAETASIRARLIRLRIQEHFALNRPEVAISEGIRAIRDFGLRFSTRPIKYQIIKQLLIVRAYLKRTSLNDLDDIPDVTDERLLAVSNLFSIIGIAARVSQPELLFLMVLRHILMFKQYGVFPETSFALAAYGMLLTSRAGSEDEGDRVCEMALHLSERAICAKKSGHTRFLVSSTVKVWREPLRQTLELSAELEQQITDVGDHEYLTSASHAYGIYRLCAGEELESLQDELHRIASDIERIGQWKHLYYLRMYQVLVRSLIEGGTRLEDASNGICDSAAILRTWNETSDDHGLFTASLTELIFCYFNQQYDDAIRAGDRADRYLMAVIGMMTIPLYTLFDSLSRLAMLREKEGGLHVGQGRALLKKVNRNQKRMKNWAQHGPMNFAHKFSLVEAERQRFLGNSAAAIEHYAAAIRGAKENHYLHEEALANELAGQFQYELGNEAVGGVFLAEAARLYRKWGALSVLRRLETRYPCCREEDDAMRDVERVAKRVSRSKLPSSSQSAKTPRVAFDVDGLIRVAEAFTAEVNLSKLLDKVLEVLMEISGAGRVVLLVEQENGWTLGADSEPDLREEGRDESPWPDGVVTYVGRTRKTVMTGSEDWDALLGSDPYLKRVNPRSALCFPLSSQATVVGIVYMENRLAQGVFEDDVLGMLKMLSAQAASAIEKARLYETLERQKHELAELVDAKSKEVETVAEELDLRSKLYTVDGETAETISRTLTRLMVEKHVYRDPGLTLESLSEASGYAPRSVSEVINSCFGKNFYTFLNDYRVEEVKKRLADPSEAGNVLEISGDAGFASKSTFNAFFKKSTGMTPTAYRKSKH